MYRLSFFATAQIALALAPGCDAPCWDPDALNGDHTVWSNVLQHEPGLDDIQEAYPNGLVFYNGRSLWYLVYAPVRSAFDLLVGDSIFDASFSRDEAYCSHFQLAFGGRWVHPQSDCEHDFVWQASLVHHGDHLEGTWDYSAIWSSPTTDSKGRVEASGNIYATPGLPDTGEGFSE